MGHIHMPAEAFRAALSEDAGVRSGFTLTQIQMLEHLPCDHHLREVLAGNEVLRLGSDEYADAVGDLLYALGVAAEPGMPTLANRFMKNTTIPWWSLYSLDKLLTLEAICRHHAKLQSEGHSQADGLAADINECLGHIGAEIVVVLQAAMDEDIAQNPFYSTDVELGDIAALDDLFKSEKLPMATDHFFNQSFVNYLNANPNRLSDMHWRQFEGLTAEWFQRQGYEVKLGPGRNDGSIDMRLWKNTPTPGAPPTVIVQCKRQKSKVERIVVKALYADILEERAASGLIVTTSSVSPGAAEDIAARSYPITSANRDAVEEWVRKMATPRAGIVT